LNKLQKLINQIHRWIIFYGFWIGSCISLIVFILTIIYIILKRRCLNRNDYDMRYSIESNDTQQQYKKKHKSAMNAFLWHDDYLNG
jgi:heme/copper-type cytochrome/quinol oxidase subunit 2